MNKAIQNWSAKESTSDRRSLKTSKGNSVLSALLGFTH